MGEYGKKNHSNRLIYRNFVPCNLSKFKNQIVVSVCVDHLTLMKEECIAVLQMHTETIKNNLQYAISFQSRSLVGAVQRRRGSSGEEEE